MAEEMKPIHPMSRTRTQRRVGYLDRSRRLRRREREAALRSSDLSSRRRRLEQTLELTR